MDYAEFARRLKEEPQPAAAYVFYGEEPYLMQRGLESLVERYGLQPAGRWEAAERSWGQIAGALAAGFLMGPRRVLTLVYRKAPPEPHAAALAAHRAGPTLLVVHLETEKLPFDPPETAHAVRCRRPDRDLLTRWIRKELAARGLAAAPDAMGLMTAAFLGRPLLACLHTLEAIACHAGAAARVERADVEPFVAPDSTATAFRVCDALVQRRAGEAVEIVRDLLERGEPPVRLHGAIAWGYYKLLEAHHRLRAGQNRVEVGRSVGLKYNADSYVGAAERLGAGGLRRSFEALAEADALLKSGSSRSAELVMETMVYRLARAGRD